MNAKITWVLVADAGSAQVYSKFGATGRMTEVEDGSFRAPSSHGQDVYADERGRSFESVGEQRHAMERPTSAEDQGRRRFARRIVEWLEQPGKGHGYQQLAIAAEPRMLGELRDLMPDRLRRKVIAELDKDLTKASIEEIARTFDHKIRP